MSGTAGPGDDASETPRREIRTRRAPATCGDRRGRRPRAPRSLGATLGMLEALAAAGPRVALHVRDLDSGQAVIAGDDHVPLPVGGLGIVPLLVEAAARFDDDTLDPFELVERPGDAATAGVWRSMAAPALPLADLAVLAASAGDALAANALLERVGHDHVTRRLVALGMPRSALLDGFRARRGPDDAPHLALGTAREFTALFAGLVNGRVVNPAVSAQVAEWLALEADVGLVGAAVGADPHAHDDDAHGLLFVNKTGREPGVRAEAGVLAGPRAGVAYALFVAFEERSALDRHRVHEAFHGLGRDLMEYVH